MDDAEVKTKICRFQILTLRMASTRCENITILGRRIATVYALARVRLRTGPEMGQVPHKGDCHAGFFNSNLPQFAGFMLCHMIQISLVSEEQASALCKHSSNPALLVILHGALEFSTIHHPTTIAFCGNPERLPRYLG
jgi:hypothetical protein